MGINGLLPQLKSITNKSHLSKYRGKRVAVDAYSWLHKGAYSCPRELVEGIPTDKCVQYCMNRIDLLLHNGIIPYVVFDGGPLPNKADEEKTRQRSRDENRCRARTLWAQGNKTAALECYQRAVDITPEVANGFTEALQKRGIQFIVAPYEADAQMAYLALNGFVDIVLTEDSDLLTYGCPTVCFKLDKLGNGEEISLKDLPMCRELNFVGWNHELFVEMCVMAGCDFAKALPGIGVKKAHAALRRTRSFQRATRALKYDGVQVPADYEKRVQRAIWTFRHQRVFCPNKQAIVYLHEPHNGDLTAHAVVPHAAVLEEGEEDFLGPLIDDGVAASIACGNLNPITKQPYRGVRKQGAGAAATGNIQSLLLNGGSRGSGSLEEDKEVLGGSDEGGAPQIHLQSYAHLRKGFKRPRPANSVGVNDNDDNGGTVVEQQAVVNNNRQVSGLRSSLHAALQSNEGWKVQRKGAAVITIQQPQQQQQQQQQWMPVNAAAVSTIQEEELGIPSSPTIEEELGLAHHHHNNNNKARAPNNIDINNNHKTKNDDDVWQWQPQRAEAAFQALTSPLLPPPSSLASEEQEEEEEQADALVNVGIIAAKDNTPWQAPQQGLRLLQQDPTADLHQQMGGGGGDANGITPGFYDVGYSSGGGGDHDADEDPILSTGLERLQRERQVHSRQLDAYAYNNNNNANHNRSRQRDVVVQGHQQQQAGVGVDQEDFEELFGPSRQQRQPHLQQLDNNDDDVDIDDVLGLGVGNNPNNTHHHRHQQQQQQQNHAGGPSSSLLPPLHCADPIADLSHLPACEREAKLTLDVVVGHSIRIAEEYGDITVNGEQHQQQQQQAGGDGRRRAKIRVRMGGGSGNVVVNNSNGVVGAKENDTSGGSSRRRPQQGKGSKIKIVDSGAAARPTTGKGTGGGNEMFSRFTFGKK